MALENGEIEKFVGLKPEHFNQIISHCREHERSPKISTAARLFIFLKFAREGRSENMLAKDIGICQSTVSRIIHEMIDDLVAVAPHYIKFPTTKEEIVALERGFLSKCDHWGRPRNVPCFGTIDGKHWATEHPPHSGSLNANYKKFFSYNSLFVCDSDGRVMYLEVSELGVNNDAQLFRDSPLPLMLHDTVKAAGYRLLDDNITILPPFLVGDNGFGFTKHIMQPYRGELSDEQMRFNRKLSAVRVSIENVFGRMNSKFQVFDRNLKLAPHYSRCLIAALSVVHNIQLGPFPLCDVVNSAMMSDPYGTPEEMRIALKNYMLG
ncbi:hypothetical protein CAEBREN_28482 [Caenorhabditis brenneri]|uniref:DDE Tnp4 domain-containing protein n=1 Tax=Caenorhabditis brenneri TaxID=135651 RepID=G0PEX1_CAEBE|nr:hypothetical protein CAEBREN_28482 [Caenorhabditis brenneri]